MLRRRSDQRELMDDLNYKGDDLEITLQELDFINKWLGVAQISLSAFSRLASQHKIHSIADLGCGSGKFLSTIKNRFPEVACTGVDANAAIIDYAKKTFPGIEFISENIQDSRFSNRKFDILHCCLFLHHFTDDELIDLFVAFTKQAKVGVIVNDLHRHFLAYHAIALLTRFFSRSGLVRHDAKLSVQRGFKRRELVDILDRAGIKRYQLSWKWAFRWQLIIYTNP